MACADLSAPVSMAQTSGDMDSVPTLASLDPDSKPCCHIRLQLTGMQDPIADAAMLSRVSESLCQFFVASYFAWTSLPSISLGRGACTRSRSCSRFPLGAGATAFCSSFAEFLLMDCITAVEPSARVRVRILPTSDEPRWRTNTSRDHYVYTPTPTCRMCYLLTQAWPQGEGTTGLQGQWIRCC